MRIGSPVVSRPLGQQHAHKHRLVTIVGAIMLVTKCLGPEGPTRSGD